MLYLLSKAASLKSGLRELYRFFNSVGIECNKRKYNFKILEKNILVSKL